MACKSLFFALSKRNNASFFSLDSDVAVVHGLHVRTVARAVTKLLVGRPLEDGGRETKPKRVFFLQLL